MRKLSLVIGLTVMLAGCARAPASKTTDVVTPVAPAQVEPTKVVDASWSLANPCTDGVEEVYQTPDGSYVVWISSRWVKLSPLLTPEQFCADNIKGSSNEN